ncbi:MAG: hypothetical protein ACE5D7_08100 [Fidelibacterota bacterium]
MKITQCLPLVFITVLVGLVSCQRNAPVSSEGKTLSNQVEDDIQPTHEVGGGGSGFNDTIPIDGSAEIREDTSKTKNEISVQAAQTDKKGESVVSGSIYPKEYHDARGREAYIKMWKGVYAYLDNFSGKDYDLVVARIDFFDTLGTRINEFDVLKNNPYNKERIANLEGDNYQAYVYRAFMPKSLTSGKSEYEPRHFYSYIQMPSSHSMPVIGYHLLGAIDGGVTDWKFTAICLDEKGNVLRKFEDLDIDPYEFCLSENKKFFCVAYGGLRGENLTRLRNNGFRIYEVETGKMVYEMEVDEKHTISGPAADDSHENIPFGSVGIRGNDFADKDDRSKIYIRIDFNNRVLYKRKLSQQEREALKGGYDKDGFVMEDPLTKRRWKLLYREDFEIEKF